MGNTGRSLCRAVPLLSSLVVLQVQAQPAATAASTTQPASSAQAPSPAQAASAAQTANPPGMTSLQRLAPAIDPLARRNALLGRWYGETTTQEGHRLQWITEREANGTYRTHYRSQMGNGSVEESIELGQWGISGSVLFTLQRAWIRNEETQRADPGNAYSSDAFDLLALNEQAIEYRSAGSGKRFTVRRVGPEHRFPAQSTVPRPADATETGRSAAP